MCGSEGEKQNSKTVSLPFQWCKPLWRFILLEVLQCCVYNVVMVPYTRGIIRFLLLYGLQHCKQTVDNITLVLTYEMEVAWPCLHENLTWNKSHLNAPTRRSKKSFVFLLSVIGASHVICTYVLYVLQKCRNTVTVIHLFGNINIYKFWTCGLVYCIY